jgi:hypothetical protein
MGKFILDILLIFKIDLKKFKIKKVRWEYSMNPFFLAQSKHKTQTTMQFFGFLFFLTYQDAF